ncbi:MAG: prepilin-type N-terminal cleavage/methylation domain-containing protein [bacterium]
MKQIWQLISTKRNERIASLLKVKIKIPPLGLTTDNKRLQVDQTKGFTLIELLLVLAIMGILMATVITNYIGFDVEARMSVSKSNLETIRTRIMLFRAKTGHYPESLEELTKTYYLDAGVKKPYLKEMPFERISPKDGRNSFIDASSQDHQAPITNEGGWVYLRDMAEVKINYNKPLDSKWEGYEGQIPSEW